MQQFKYQEANLLTYIKLIESSSQFSDASMTVLLFGGRGGLSGAGNAPHGLLDLFKHVVSVGPCGCYIWVAQEGLRGRVQHGGVFLQSPTSSCHLISTLGVFQLLKKKHNKASGQRSMLGLNCFTFKINIIKHTVIIYYKTKSAFYKIDARNFIYESFPAEQTENKVHGPFDEGSYSNAAAVSADWQLWS